MPTIAIVGASLTGASAAATLREEGFDGRVVLLGAEPQLPYDRPPLSKAYLRGGMPFEKTLLYRALGEEIGRVVEGLHRDHGVELVLGDAVSAFEGNGRVERVVTRSGRRVECELAVFGLGIEPATELVAGTSVRTDNGIVVDEYCRTNVPGIFAAGDVANHYHPVCARQMRVEHWQNGVKQGAAAARSMLGRAQPYDEVHWFWSDQYDANIQYAGFHAAWDAVVVRGSLPTRKFMAFYMAEGRVESVVAINQGRDLRRALPIIKARVAVDPARLEDPNVDRVPGR